MATKPPELPELYAPCIELSITSHRPPEPFGKETYKLVKTPGVPDISREMIEQLGDNALTFAHHLRERERHAPAMFAMPGWFMDGQQATLKIICPISHGKWGPQVVLCEVVKPPRDLWKKMGQENPDLVVAKIFDPLHYYDCDDRVAEADREYAEEAAAYMHLHEQRTNKAYKPGFVPQYFGSWTTDITLDHLRKPFMGKDDKKATADTEAKVRAAFDADVLAASKAAAGAEAADAPSPATELKIHDFRPVRLVLLQYIKGTPLSRHLVRKVDSQGENIIAEPKPDFKEEKIRTEIFGDIMDTVVRIEHLGINTSSLTPSMFIITDKTDEKIAKKKNKTKKSKKSKKSEEDDEGENPNDKSYGVVMTDFTQADVTRYTRMGYNIH